MSFKALHHSDRILILPNAWDARSAAAFQQNNYKAVATSSMAVAESLGYEDGEQMSFEEYLFVIRRIMAVANVPVTVDMEMGYGDVLGNIQRIVDLGVAGINIEDSLIASGARVLGNAVQFAEVVAQIKAKFPALFVNVRCDTYLLNTQLEETAARLAAYEAAGADGIFLPCIVKPADITAAVSYTSLPLNVMIVPGLPDLATLWQLGVKRVSMGPAMFGKAYEVITTLTQQLLKDGHFSSISS